MMQTSNNKRSKTSNDASGDTNATQTTRLVVPTFTNKNNTEELDLHSMTEEELKMLQKIGEQTRLDVVVAFSSLVSDDPLSQSCSLLWPTLVYETDPFLYYSIPAVREAALSLKEVDYSQVSQSAHKVTRKTRVSFENVMNLTPEELFGNELDGLEESVLGELGDMLNMLFSSTEWVTSITTISNKCFCMYHIMGWQLKELGTQREAK